MRGILIAIVAVGVVALVVIFGFKGGENKTVTATVGTVSTTSAAAQKGQAPERAGSAGAGVEEGPGSASTASGTGAPAAAGIASTTTQLQKLVRPFADTSPWNTVVTGQPTDDNSSTYLQLANKRVGVIENGSQPPKKTTIVNQSGLFINTARWTSPIWTTANGVETRMICRQLTPYCGDGRDLSSLSVPTNAYSQPQYDGPFALEDLAAGVAWTMFRARRGDGNVFSYQFMRKWDLNGPGYQVPNSVSTIGSGLPSFAGYLHPEEVRAGRINHALAIAVPGPAQQFYVQPASATDGTGSVDSLPEGARIRLKPGVKAPKLLGETNAVAQRAIMTALRTYGAIVVERSDVPTLYAKQNYNWAAPMKSAGGKYLSPNGRVLSAKYQHARYGTPLLRGNELQGLHLSDFEVVEITGKKYQFPAPDATETAVRPLPDQNSSLTGVTP